MRCAVIAESVPLWLEQLRRAYPLTIVAPQEAETLCGRYDLVIRWATLRGRDPVGCRVINRKRALALVREPALVVRRLAMNGLETGSYSISDEERSVPLFRVEVFDLRPLALRRIINDDGRRRFRSAQGMSSRVVRRATAAAIRALHALGLDTGRVDIAVFPPAGGLLREQVCAINPAPAWPGLLAEPLARLLQSAAVHREPTWLLGADPEFVFMATGTETIVPASRYLPRRGRVGCDAQTIAGGSREHLLAELRPAPAANPSALVGALNRCLHEAARLVPSPTLTWLAGSGWGDGISLGGHIHFSGAKLHGNLLRALDTYLAVPVFLVEDATRAAVRRRRHGFLGDIRFKDHGGFEYRTLPSWLVEPKLARAVLSLAAWIAYDYRYLHRDLFLDTELMTAFYEGNKQPFYDVIDLIRADLLGTPSRNRFAPAVEHLFRLISRRQEWVEHADLRSMWRISVAQTMVRQPVPVQES